MNLLKVMKSVLVNDPRRELRARPFGRRAEHNRSRRPERSNSLGASAGRTAPIFLYNNLIIF
jgi:hypothetical protein